MSNRHQVVQLDVLRGLAALIVVVSHAANAELLPNALGQGFGQMGVGIFYLLSAFLLTRLYSHQEFTGRRVCDYLIRRGARVLPLFYAALLVSVFAECLVGISIFGASASLYDFVGNAFLIQGTSVLWSIPVEVQFYLIFLGFWWLLPSGVSIALGFLVLVQASLLFLSKGGGLTTNSLPYWMHFFTIGCAFGLMVDRPALSDRIARSSLSKALIFLTIIGTVLALPGVRRMYLGLEPWANYIDPINVVWITLLSAGFVFKIVHKQWVDNKLFRFLGEVSFSVYILHMVFIIALSGLTDDDLILPYDRFLIALVATYVAAALVTRNFERPAQEAILRTTKHKGKKKS